MAITEPRTELPRGSAAASRVAVVMITRNRRDEALSVLDRLRRSDPTTEVLVIDNGSTDGTAAAVRTLHPEVRLLEPGTNLGAAGRNLGAMSTDAPFVAFCDDDSWWEDGSLGRAAAHLAANPSLAALCGAIHLPHQDELDATSDLMARSPLPGRVGEPGARLVGFCACATMVRRDAFLAAGGFDRRFGVGGEEELLAVDLLDAGWGIGYAPDVTVCHRPSPTRTQQTRARLITRNHLWALWLRRPVTDAAQGSIRLIGRAVRRDPWRVVAAAVWEATRALPWVLRERRVVASSTPDLLRSVER
jgi:GT2 family glycosyltransferase